MISRLAVGLLGAFALTACSTASRSPDAALDPVSGIAPGTAASLSTVWSTAGVGSIDRRAGIFRLVLRDDLVYVAGSRGTTQAVDTATGAVRWERRLSRLSAGVSEAAGLLTVVDTNGAVIALDANDGNERWRADVGGAVVTPTGAAGALVVAQSEGGRLVGIEAMNGALRWAVRATQPEIRRFGSAQPKVITSGLLVGMGDGSVAALRLGSGNLIWDSNVVRAKNNGKINDIDGTIAIAAGLVLAASVDGGVAALSPADGRVVWRQAMSVDDGVATAAGLAIVSNQSSAVVALSASDGAARWQTQLDPKAGRIGVVAARGQWVAAAQGDRLHLLRAADGVAVAQLPIGVDIVDIAIGASNQLYLLGRDGRVSALAVK